MTTIKKLGIASLAVVMMLVGCQDEKLVAPMSDTKSDLTSLSKGRVVQSATGSGHITLGEFRTFTFTARKYADGSVNGEWQLVVRSANVTLHGNVTCLTVVGNQAWVGGVVERPAPFSTPPDNGCFFRVVDNGEGANNPPDQISLMRVLAPPGLAELYCSVTPPAPDLINIEQGNVQVR